MAILAEVVSLIAVVVAGVSSRGATRSAERVALGAGIAALGAAAAASGFHLANPPVFPAGLPSLALVLASVFVLASAWTWRRGGDDDGSGARQASWPEVDEAPADAGRRRLERAFAVGRHGFLEVDLRDRSVLLSDGLVEILGVSRGELTHINRFEALLDTGDWQRFRSALNLVEMGFAHRAAGDYRFHRSSTEPVWLHARFDVGERDVNGRALRLLVVATDVDERKQREVRLAHLALHDALTGLANRAAFLERQARTRPDGNALLLVDLDGFKQVNDRFGHLIGDAWLAEVARRLQQVVRRGDFVARIGGDEFAVLPRGHLHCGELEDLAQRIVDRLREPFAQSTALVAASASVGLAYWKANGEASATVLYPLADRALYAAKRRGSARYVVLRVDDKRPGKVTAKPAAR